MGAGEGNLLAVCGSSAVSQEEQQVLRLERRPGPD